ALGCLIELVRLEHRRAFDGELELRWVTAGLFGGFLRHAEAPFQRGQRHARGEPAVCILPDALELAAAFAAEPDRDACGTDGLRVAGPVHRFVELAAEIDELLGPERAHKLQALIHALSAALEWDGERFE